MATMTIPDALYEQLRHKAAVHRVPLEEIVIPALQQRAEEPDPTAEGRHSEFEAWLADFTADARSREDRYPPGFECDVSRESIYEGCGE